MIRDIRLLRERAEQYKQAVKTAHSDGNREELKMAKGRRNLCRRIINASQTDLHQTADYEGMRDIKGHPPGRALFLRV
ncbi:hypothetical protein [Corynebacterium sp. ES2715-CONJ3]|uniref:hypothetical protein n=1 Tax=Corynebacterium sp. ES2715-CONJ3 TaxID=2974028 RepID=UPI00216A5C86|nr:hypothetical protein [Corynebacterium sp. ES2715-CONJ3]MCS4491553.1 hypothetical protein [Corynebacterium sp. ES2715-CONJ3]